MRDERPSRGSRHPLTTFGQYLRDNRVPPSLLSRESGYSRQHIYRLSRGLGEPTRRCMVALMVALRRLLRNEVQMIELWDVENVSRLDIRQPGDE